MARFIRAQSTEVPKMKTMFLVESVAHKRGGVLLCLACNLIWVIYLSGTDFLTYHCSLALIIQDSSQHIILPRLFDTILQNCDIVTKDDKGRHEKEYDSLIVKMVYTGTRDMIS